MVLRLWMLYKIDPALQALRPALITTFLAALLIRQTSGGLVTGPTGPVVGFSNDGFIQAYIILGYLVMMFLFTGNLSTHCGRLSLTLPLTARQIWTTRLLALLSVGLLPMAVSILVMSVQIDSSRGAVSLNGSIVVLGLHAAAALTMCIAVMQTPSVALQRVGQGVSHLVFLLAVGFGTMMTAFLTVSWPSIGILFAGIAAVLIGREYRALPSSFSTVPLYKQEKGETPLDHTQTPDDPGGQEATGRPSARREFAPVSYSRPHRKRLYFTISRQLHNNFQSWVGILLLLLVGERLFVSVCVAKDTLTYAVPATALIYIVFFNTMRRTHAIAPWPISRKLLFAHCCGPALLMLVLGLGIGALELAGESLKYNHIAYRNHSIVIPPEFAEITWDGRVEPVTAPWGESYTPRSLSVLPALKLKVYNPFEHGPESSPLFVAFQIERAAAAIHEQRAYDPVEFDTSILDETYEAQIKNGTFTVAQSAGRPSSLRVRTTATACLVLGLLGVPILYTAFEQLKLNPQRKRFQGITLVAIVIFAGTYIVGAIGEISRFSSQWAINAFGAVLFRDLAHRLPLSTAWVWACAGLVYVAWYFIAQWRFAHIDLVPLRGESIIREH